MAKIAMFAVAGSLSALAGGLLGEASLMGWRAISASVVAPEWVGIFARVALWTACIGLLLALGLVVGQNLYLRRRPIGLGEFAKVAAGSLAAGLAAGVAGQGMQSVLERMAAGAMSIDARAEMSRALGWMLLGGLLAVCIALFVPNLPKTRAALAGAIGGLLGAWAFFDLSVWLGDTAGRLVGVVALGACVGSMVAVAERAFRKAWLEVVYGPSESRTVSLGAEPVTVGSSSGSTIFARGSAARALRFFFRDGRVVCEDIPAGRSTTLTTGDSRRAGALLIRVHGGAAGTASMVRLVVAGRRPVTLRPGVTFSAKDIPGLLAAEGRGSVAEVVTNPTRSDSIGLKNLSTRTWKLTIGHAAPADVPPGRSAEIQAGRTINFGQTTGSMESAPASAAAAMTFGGSVPRMAVAAGVAAGLLVAGAADFRRRHPATAPSAAANSLPISILSLAKAAEQRPLRLGVLPTRSGYDDVGVILKDLGPGYLYNALDWDRLAEPNDEIGSFDVLFLPCPGLPSEALGRQKVADMEQAAEAEPTSSKALDYITVLVTHPDESLRNGSRALTMAQAIHKSGDVEQWKSLQLLARTYAELGDFAKAIEAVDKAIADEQVAKVPGLLAIFRGERQLFEAGKPVREGIAPKRVEQIERQLHEYVSGGGTLYASCLAWNSIKRIFAEVVAAEVDDRDEKFGLYTAQQDVAVQVVDPSMVEEFGDTITLSFDLPGWSPPSINASNTTVYLRGGYSMRVNEVSLHNGLAKRMKIEEFNERAKTRDADRMRRLDAIKRDLSAGKLSFAAAEAAVEELAREEKTDNQQRDELGRDFDRQKADMLAAAAEETKRNGPLLIKTPFGKGCIIFTAFHNGKQRSRREIELLRHLVYTTVTARLEARTKEQLVEAGFTAARHDLVTRSPGSPERKGIYQCSRSGPLRFAIAFNGVGVRLRLDLTSPDGRTASHQTSESVVVEVKDASAGEWSYTVTAEQLPSSNFPFTITIAER